MTVTTTIVCSCASEKKWSEIDLIQEETPPNGVRIGDFYCDQTETTNFNWLEYMFWTKRTYGPKSKEYLQTQIDPLVWLDDDSCNIDLTKHYLRHPAYRDYPVVGISQNQAEQYSKWRSDRVFEYMLIRDGIIEYNDSQNEENVFTIANFFSGKIERIDTVTRVSYYPEFSIPSSIDRQEILEYADSLDKKYSSKYHSKHPRSKEISIIHSDITPCSEDSTRRDPTRPVQSYYSPKRVNPIYDLRGNVSEWAKENSTTFGGSWGNEIEQIRSFDTIKASVASKYIGFRNICRYRKWGEK